MEDTGKLLFRHVMKITALACIAFVCGCATKHGEQAHEFQPGIHYHVKLNRGVNADIVQRDGAIQVVLVRNDEAIGDFSSDGSLTSFGQLLSPQNPGTNTSIHIWTRDGKLLRHYFEFFPTNRGRATYRHIAAP